MTRDFAGVCSIFIDLQLEQRHAGWPVSDSKIHGVNMEPVWGRQDPGGPHVDIISFAIRDV